MNEDYLTSDMGMTAALWTLGQRYAPREDDGRMIFVFVRSPELDFMVNQYFNGDLMVPARRFNDNIRTIKASLYNLKRNQYEV